DAIHKLKTVTAGRLPVLEGFAVAGEHPLDQFQRGYYQCAVQVSSADGGTLVRVTAKITAWHQATDAAKSGYQELASNGRLESDFLDQLSDTLKGTVEAAPATSATKRSNETVPAISAPTPHDKVPGEPIGASKGSLRKQASPFGTSGSGNPSATQPPLA